MTSSHSNSEASNCEKLRIDECQRRVLDAHHSLLVPKEQVRGLGLRPPTTVSHLSGFARCHLGLCCCIDAITFVYEQGTLCGGDCANILKEQTKPRIPNRISGKKVYPAALAVWHNTNVAARIAREAETIIDETFVMNHFFFNGKSFRRIICGLFFLLGYKHNVAVSETEIAGGLGTSDVTVRRSYREWLETFPELFKHILPKLSENVMLRPFVQPS